MRENVREVVRRRMGDGVSFQHRGLVLYHALERVDLICSEHERAARVRSTATHKVSITELPCRGCDKADPKQCPVQPSSPIGLDQRLTDQSDRRHDGKVESDAQQYASPRPPVSRPLRSMDVEQWQVRMQAPQVRVRRLKRLVGLSGSHGRLCSHGNAGMYARSAPDQSGGQRESCTVTNRGRAGQVALSGVGPRNTDNPCVAENTAHVCRECGHLASRVCQAKTIYDQS